MYFEGKVEVKEKDTSKLILLQLFETNARMKKLGKSKAKVFFLLFYCFLFYTQYLLIKTNAKSH